MNKLLPFEVTLAFAGKTEHIFMWFMMSVMECNQSQVDKFACDLFFLEPYLCLIWLYRPFCRVVFTLYSHLLIWDICV